MADLIWNEPKLAVGFAADLARRTMQLAPIRGYSDSSIEKCEKAIQIAERFYDGTGINLGEARDYARAPYPSGAGRIAQLACCSAQAAIEPDAIKTLGWGVAGFVDMACQEARRLGVDADAIEVYWRIRDWTRGELISDDAHDAVVAAFTASEYRLARDLCEGATMNRSVIVQGDNFEVRLVRLEPGKCEMQVEIADAIVGRVPFDNIVKARTRIDPKHASEAEKQIAALRAQVGDLLSREIDFNTAKQQINRAQEEAAQARDERDKAISELAYVRANIKANQPDARVDALEAKMKELSGALEKLQAGAGSGTAMKVNTQLVQHDPSRVPNCPCDDCWDSEMRRG